MEMMKQVTSLGTELGPIPADWQFKKFGDVFTGFTSGQTPRRNRPDFYRGEIKWITSGELNYNVITDTKEKITKEAVTKTSLKVIPKGTFLFAITGLEAEGTRGSCAITGTEATTNQSCMALYPKGEVSTEYLFHFYIKYGKELALRYCQGTKQQSYTGGIARLLPITYPPTKSEQTAIATALSDADALITALEKLIEKKRNIKQGVMQELLRPKKGWTTRRIGDIFDFIKSANNSRADLADNGGIGYIHYGDIHTKWKYFLDAELDNYPFISHERVSNIPFLKEGDIVMADASEDYEGLGVSVELKNLNSRKIVAGLHTMVLRSKPDQMSNGFKGYLRELPGFKDQLRSIATGISVFGISKTQIKTLEITVPPYKEQTEIALTLNLLQSEIQTLDNLLKKIKLIKQGMMQELLTGKTRLK